MPAQKLKLEIELFNWDCRGEICCQMQAMQVVSGYWYHSRVLEMSPLASRSPPGDLLELHRSSGALPSSDSTSTFQRNGKKNLLNSLDLVTV